jgi:predicted nucleotidyltransferase
VAKPALDLHLIVAERTAAALAERPDVLTVMIAGSVARGQHVASSDVDLLVVSSEDADLPTSERSLVDGLLVEWIARSEPDWLSRFDRPKTSWLYAFLDARVVSDRGPGVRLQTAARDVLSTYRTGSALRELLATWLWHGQAKLDRARDNPDPMVRGYWAALFVETVADSLFAVHDVPLPAGARRLDYLHMVALTARETELLDATLTGDTERRFDATCALVTDLRGQLGAPDHGL